jgi:hypothetical protein
VIAGRIGKAANLRSLVFGAEREARGNSVFGRPCYADKDPAPLGARRA